MSNPRPGRNGTTHLFILRGQSQEEIPWEKFMKVPPLKIELTQELMDLWIRIAIEMWLQEKKEHLNDSA